jgi:hypothetical protein
MFITILAYIIPHLYETHLPTIVRRFAKSKKFGERVHSQKVKMCHVMTNQSKDI